MNVIPTQTSKFIYNQANAGAFFQNLSPDELTRLQMKHQFETRKKQIEKHLQEKELVANHGDDGHHVAKVLHQIESYGQGKKFRENHIVFAFTPKQLWVLEKSHRYKALKAMFDITHEIIEGEVEHIIKFYQPIT